MSEKQASPYPIRLTKDVREQLEIAAKAAGRSLNAEMVMRLEQSLADSGGVIPAMDADISRYPVRLAVGLPAWVHDRLKLQAARTHHTVNGALVVTLEAAYYTANRASRESDDGEYSTANARGLIRALSKQIAEYEKHWSAFYAASAEAEEAYAAEQAVRRAAMTPEERDREIQEAFKDFEAMDTPELTPKAE